MPAEWYSSNTKKRDEKTFGDFLGGMVKGIGGAVAATAAPVNPALGAAIHGGSTLVGGALSGDDLGDTFENALTGAAVTGVSAGISNAILGGKEDEYLKALLNIETPPVNLVPSTPERILRNKPTWFS